MILHGIRIQQYQVSFHACSQQTAIGNADGPGCALGHGGNRYLERHGTAVSHVSGKNTREGAVASWMSGKPAIRTNIGKTPLDEAGYVIFVHRAPHDGFGAEPAIGFCPFYGFPDYIRKRLRFVCASQNSNVSNGQSDIAGFGSEIRKNDAISRRDTFKDKANLFHVVGIAIW